MAPKLTPAAEPEATPLGKEAGDRLKACRAQKELVADDIREAYFFTKPRLHRNIRSTSPNRPAGRVKDEHELVTGVGTEVAEDFATEVINAFFPAHYDWCASGPPGWMPAEEWERVKEEAAALDKAVFQEIRASNFDAAIARALIPDCAIGTFALWIDAPEPGEAVRVQHVPLRELEINVGPFGEVGDRFVVRHTTARDLPAVLPGVALPEKYQKMRVEKPDKDVCVSWGFWRLWDKRATERWQHVVMVDDVVVANEVLEGRGCCRLIVVRFAPDSLHAFGNGPTIDSLPMLRVLDMLTEAQQNRASTAMSPSFVFPDDGVINFEGGIQDGKAYPMRPGSGEVQPLYFQGDLDFGMFTVADLVRGVRRKHFADYPEQLGKTPPTASQWVDEMVKAQRRIGTPGAAFWHEGPAEIFARFRYLAIRRGRAKAVERNGLPVSLQPSNPAIKAQEQQEVQITIRLLEILYSFWPDIMPALVEPIPTIQRLKEKMGDKLLELRPPEESEQMIEMILQQAQQAMASEGGGEALAQ